MSKHYLVLGSTGPTGLLFCKTALEQGHTLTIFARTPSKLPAEISSHRNVKEVIQGSFTDEKALSQAARCGADVCVSFAGPPQGQKGTIIADAYQKLIPMLIENHMPRAMFLSTPSFKAPGDVDAWKWGFVCGTIKLVFRTGWEEMVKIGQVVSATPKEQLRWTLFRVGFLKDGPSDEIVISHPGSGKDGLNINRAGIVSFVLREAEENQYVGKTPLLSNK